MNFWVFIYRIALVAVGILVIIGVIFMFLPQIEQQRELQRKEAQLGGSPPERGIASAPETAAGAPPFRSAFHRENRARGIRPRQARRDRLQIRRRGTPDGQQEITGRATSKHTR